MPIQLFDVPATQEEPRRSGAFTKIGRILTATSLGLQGKDPSVVFDDIDKPAIDPLKQFRTGIDTVNALAAAGRREEAQQLMDRILPPSISQETADIRAQAVPGLAAPEAEPLPEKATAAQQAQVLDGDFITRPTGQTITQKGLGETIKTEFDVERTAEAEGERQADIQKAKDIEKINVKKEALAKDLDDFFAVDDVIDRSEGGFISRMLTGGSTMLASMDQSTAEGAAAATHNAIRKRLRVSLVRAAGDVGNINIVEQKAAEQIIPGFFDSKKTAAIKRAFLQEFSKAVDSKEESVVRKVIQEFMGTEAYKPLKFGSEEEVEKAKLPAGTIIEINGRRARIK
jgi:hypothetical protein